MFNVLWTILLGIIGGVISSVIVSRVFMIQGEYQQQVKFVERIIKKLGVISGYLNACRAVFEASYDQDIRIENEMKEKGYKCEMEYYVANKDKDWISTRGILKTFKSHLLENAKAAIEEILNSDVTDEKLNGVLVDINGYLHTIESVKELNFSIINGLKEEEKEILEKFETYKSVSGEQLIKLVLKDKIMIVLYGIMGLIIIFTGLSFALGM